MEESRASGDVDIGEWNIHHYVSNLTNLTRYGDIHRMLGMYGFIQAKDDWCTDSSQFLTATVGIALILRYALKTWVCWFLPRTFIPDKVWGLEDLLVFAGYGFDIIHMTTVELRFESRSDGQNEVIDICSSQWGLGRPFQYLEPFEQSRVLRYGHISQPFGIYPDTLIDACWLR